MFARPKSAARAIAQAALDRLPVLSHPLRFASTYSSVARSVARRLHPRGTFTVGAPNGTHFRYIARRGDALARNIVWEPPAAWDRHQFAAMVEACRASAGLFLDVGANVGAAVLSVCASVPAVRAVAFEANPAVAGILREQVRLNGWQDRIEVRAEAASDAPGTATFHVPANDPTAASLDPAHAERLNFGLGTVAAITVHLVRLDDALSGRPVAVAKIDVEGHELQTLRGMAGILTRDHPVLFIECLGTLAGVWDFLRPLGYRHASAITAAGIRPLSGPTDGLLGHDFMFRV